MDGSPHSGHSHPRSQTIHWLIHGLRRNGRLSTPSIAATPLPAIDSLGLLGRAGLLTEEDSPPVTSERRCAMTEEELRAIASIMVTADRGCAVCGSDLLIKLVGRFPEARKAAQAAWDAAGYSESLGRKLLLQP